MIQKRTQGKRDFVADVAAPFELARASSFDDGIEGAEAVLPRDFFAFGVSAARVGHANFINAQPHPRGFGGEFRLNAKAIFGDGDRPEFF